MAQPTQLTPTEQDALVKQIGLAMLRVAPDDWEQLTVDYRAVGRYAEATAQVVFSDSTSETWTMPTDLQGLFARLRGGMYREGRGTWFNARYRLDHPSSYNLEYDREEPRWDAPPPPQAYPDDMRLFPRTEDNVPAWLRRRLSAAPQPPRFRVARIFDGPPVDGGRPAVNRPPVDPDDVSDLLKYLDNSPVVGPGRGFDLDRFDQESRPAVPIAFHTDGTWIWPAAVNYYLREHDVPPEPDLVEHIVRAGFRPPMVDDPTRSAAAAFLGQGAGPGGPPRVPPGPPAGPPAPPPGPPAAQAPAGPAPTRALPVPPPAAPPAGGPPAAALPSQGPPGRTVDALRTRLDELGIPPTAFRIGPPAGRAWTMDQTEDGWRVGWFDREFVAPAMFEDVADASAFLLGKLMLDADRWQAASGAPVAPAPVPPPADDPGDFALANGSASAFRPDSPRSAFDFDGGADAATRFSPPAEPPRRQEFSRPDSVFEPRGAEPAKQEPAVESRHAEVRFEPEPAFDAPRRDQDLGEFDRADHGYESRRPEPARPEPRRSDLVDFDPRGTDEFDTPHAEPFEPRQTFEPAQSFEPRRTENGFELADNGFEAAKAFEPRRQDSTFEPPRPDSTFEPPRPDNTFEPPRPDSTFEPPRPDNTFEPPRQDSTFEPESRHTDNGFEPARAERAFEPTHSDQPFESRRENGFDHADQAFEPRRQDSTFEPPRPDSTFEPESRHTDNGFEHADQPFEPRHQDSGRGFDGRRAEVGFEPTRVEPALDSRHAESGLDSRSEHGFDSRRSDTAEPLARRASRATEAGMEATRVDTAAVGTTFRSEPARREPVIEPPTTIAAPASRAATGGSPSSTGSSGTGSSGAGSSGAGSSGAGSSGGGNQEWPISPMPGEPPLTLFRGKRLVELEPGTELDRFGGDDGNLAYAVGTPFHERSLVPEWVDRPYHAYRVREPVRVLTGTAIPWFDQPGGGTAYLLPDAIGELLAAGRIVEVNGRDRPPA